MDEHESDRSLVLVILAATALGSLGVPPHAGAAPATVDVQLLAINDFHGNVEPPPGSSGRIDGVDAGGAADLATHIAALRAATAAPTFVLSAGDVIGSSPLLSAYAQIAFMNPGGIRADLLFASSPAGEGDGVVTYGEAFAVQPFALPLVTMTLTGSQLELLLEQQFCGLNASPPGPRVLLPSAGFSYVYRSTTPGTPDCTSDVVASMTLNGVPIDPAATYRVTVNALLAGGGDGFPVLRDGTDRVSGPFDVDALASYLGAGAPVSPPPLNRIALVP